MLRKVLKNTSKSEKLKAFLTKYKIPKEYLSTNRRMVSKAVLLGLFIAFIPMPMQMLAVISLMPFFKFNVPIALAMCWMSNPITMPFMYYLEYLTGSFVLNIKPQPVELTLEWFTQNMDNIFIPLYSGTLIFSVVGSLSAYWAVNLFWRSSVEKEKASRRKKDATSQNLKG